MKEQERISAEKMARITEESLSATARHEETLSQERLRATQTAEKKRKDRLHMEALRQEREVLRLEGLKKREELYSDKLSRHAQLRKEEEKRRALVFQERDRKILEKQRQKEERAAELEKRTLKSVKEGGEHFRALKMKKAQDAARGALYQRLKSEEAHAKVQRQRKLDLARAKRIKVRIDKKEIQARALAEREKHLFAIRD